MLAAVVESDAGDVVPGNIYAELVWVPVEPPGFPQWWLLTDWLALLCCPTVVLTD